MRKNYLLLILIHVLIQSSYAQLPSGGQWGCVAMPLTTTFDTVCFQRTSEIKLGQGYVDIYGSSDPLYLVIPQTNPDFALSMAIAWDYFRNIVGNNSVNINQYFATMAQENGYTTFSGVQLPSTIFDAGLGTNVTLPCQYPRGCNSVSAYNANLTFNNPDGPYQFSLAGYQTAAPYYSTRFPSNSSVYQPLYSNTNLAMASMEKMYYDLALYRKAQTVNGFDLGQIESSGADAYGVEGALAYAYNMGPNAANAISAIGYTLPAGISTNTFWAGSYYSGGVSNYAQRVSAVTALLDSNQAYAVSHYGSAYGGNASNWHFYSFYDNMISWSTVNTVLNNLLPMYPELNSTTFINTVQAAFNNVNGGSPISFRYEFGSVLDVIVQNLPKDDPYSTSPYAINAGSCKNDCTSPYVLIHPQGSTTICSGQTVVLSADVDGATPSTTYQWLKNGSSITGATGQTYNATTSGTYSVVVCWSTTKISNGAAVTCCSEPQCDVTVTVNSSCSSCIMNMVLTPTSNSCTSMANGAILAAITTAAAGPYTYEWSGPSSGSINTSALSFTIPNLRDGHYTVTVYQNSDPTCKAVQDVFITPVTAIKESLSATVTPASCASQLNAILSNQQPNTCDIEVSYGTLGYSWDYSYFMDIKNNGGTILSMYKPNTSQWDWWPYTYPDPGTSAPNTTKISVSDGDTLTMEANTLVPLGTAVPSFVNGAVRLDNATFTDLTTSANSSYVLVTYQSPAPTNGIRQMGHSYKVTCPMVGTPAYTYSWSPSSGLSNPNIANPTASVSADKTYIVTATHPTNASCKLTTTVLVPANCTSLPTTFAYFDAYVEEDNIKLLWGVTHEENCKEYVVECSKDGIHFEDIGTVKCSNSSGFVTYSFIDEHPYSGVSYYKIKESDMNRNSIYSEIAEVKVEELHPYIYPNPFTSIVNISLRGDGSSSVEVTLKDIQGRELEKRNVNNYSINEFGKDQCQGIYFIELNDGMEVKIYKVVKQ